MSSKSGSLVLARKVEESIFIGSGDDQVTVKLIEVDKKYARLLIVAPKHIEVDREEVRAEKLKKESQG